MITDQQVKDYIIDSLTAMAKFAERRGLMRIKRELRQCRDRIIQPTITNQTTLPLPPIDAAGDPLPDFDI